MDATQITALNLEFKDKDILAVLELLVSHFGTGFCLASSLGLEDQLLTYFFTKLNPMPPVFILDTGRLHKETYDVMAKTQASYDFSYEVYSPNKDDLNVFIKEKGMDSFYESLENRKACCGIRKVEPLSRALKGKKAWVTGLRREQAASRDTLALFEWDSAHDLLKVNPLIEWGFDSVKEAIKKHKIPYNTLHDRGYPSIGCEPCTRAIKPGEDLRAGRWWWERADSKECGLHVQKECGLHTQTEPLKSKTLDKKGKDS